MRSPSDKLLSANVLYNQTPKKNQILSLHAWTERTHNILGRGQNRRDTVLFYMKDTSTTHYFSPMLLSLPASTTDCTLDSAPSLVGSTMAWAFLAAESPFSIADLVAARTVGRNRYFQVSSHGGSRRRGATYILRGTCNNSSDKGSHQTQRRMPTQSHSPLFPTSSMMILALSASCRSQKT